MHLGSVRHRLDYYYYYSYYYYYYYTMCDIASLGFYHPEFDLAAFVRLPESCLIARCSPSSSSNFSPYFSPSPRSGSISPSASSDSLSSAYLSSGTASPSSSTTSLGTFESASEYNLDVEKETETETEIEIEREVEKVDIHALPNELILLLGEAASFQTCAALVRTCRRFEALLNPVLWKRARGVLDQLVEEMNQL